MQEFDDPLSSLRNVKNYANDTHSQVHNDEVNNTYSKMFNYI